MSETPATPGQWLRQFRIRAEMSLRDFSGLLGRSHQAVSGWERDQYDIDGRLLPEILEILQPEPKERDHFMLARFPAFDAGWLLRQPEHRRAGLMLKACRERCGLTMEALEEKIGCSIIAPLENAFQPVSDARMKQLIGIFRDAMSGLPRKDQWFDKEMEKRFIEACDDSNPLVREQSKVSRRERYGMKAESTQIGARMGRPRKGKNFDALMHKSDSDDQSRVVPAR